MNRLVHRSDLPSDLPCMQVQAHAPPKLPYGLIERKTGCSTYLTHRLLALSLIDVLQPGLLNGFIAVHHANAVNIRGLTFYTNKTGVV